MKKPISQISIGDRRREDMGDIASLAKSIQEYGLLHPIVVANDGRLVAGGRRLEACKSLDWKEIEVTILDDLTENELRVVELEENLRRKDLSEYEQSRNMVALVETVAETLRQEVHSEVKPSKMDFPKIVIAQAGQKQKMEVGRPKKEITTSSISERIGIPRQTIQRAQQHVAAIDKYPELEPLPKTVAISTATTLDAMKPELHAGLVERVIKSTIKTPDDLEPPLSDQEKQERRAELFRKFMDKLTENLARMVRRNPEEYFHHMDHVTLGFNQIPLFAEASLEIIDDSIEWLQRFRTMYKERMLPEQDQAIRRIK